ncbi:MAG: OsmC family protein [Eubacteriales bacterium]|nr:OsmC family protein [Eubacteriales bacterium]
MDNLLVNIKRIGQKVHFEGVSESNPERMIPFDYIPPIGEGDGFAGLELLLMSFSGCVSTSIVFLIGRMGKHVASYSARAEGIRRESPLSLAKILFHVTVESSDLSDADMEAVLRQAEQISPVWHAILNNVEVEMTFSLKACG